MHQAKHISLRAYAKINLGLQIFGKRDDGYHSIETVLHRVNIYDTITLRLHRKREVHIRCSHPEIPVDHTNLCHKAAELFYSRIDSPPQVDITIKKNIPIGAGLGGGSADAAVVLLACNTLHGSPLDDEALYRLAVDIGSDVPYFLRGGSAVARGRGEILEYFQLELPYWIVVVYPRIHISTKWAYDSFSLNPQLRQHDLKALVSENVMHPRTWVNSLRNDFEPSVFRNHPTVMRVKELLIRGGADFALMSGSGSSVFGLFQDQHYAEDIARELSQLYDVWLTPPFFSPEYAFMEQKTNV